ncbi:MAG: hypothetical protein ACXWP5_11045 [Bdellovibrionota bacterium]
MNVSCIGLLLLASTSAWATDPASGLHVDEGTQNANNGGGYAVVAFITALAQIGQKNPIPNLIRGSCAMGDPAAGRPCSNLMITLLNEQKHEISSARIENGEFVFATPKRGKYFLKLHSENYRLEGDLDSSVQSGESVSFTLHPREKK